MILSPEVMEQLVAEHIDKLMKFPGCYINAPAPMINRADMAKDPLLADILRRQVCIRTEEVLNIMGMPCHRVQTHMMVEVIPNGK